ncbi:MAG: hypothetical protein Q9188_007359, partial [Gyalolechia gomerana]
MPFTITNVSSGPNWIHGVNQNPILDLAKEINATTMPAPELPPSIYDQSGQLLSPEESQKCSAIMWGIIEEAFDYSNKHSASIPQEQSLLDFFKRKLKEKDLPPSTQERILQVCRSWGDYIGGSIESQSLKYFWLEETIDGGKNELINCQRQDPKSNKVPPENLFLASTYQSILEKITKDTYTHATVHLSTKVTSITSHPSSPSQTPQIYTSVTVTTSKDQTQEYDEVITTVPLGCLKRNHQQTFHPPLPPRIQTAIKNLSYGRLEKVYLTFPSAFWLCSSSTENPTTSTTTENLNPFFNQWLAPTYTPHHFPVEC